MATSDWNIDFSPSLNTGMSWNLPAPTTSMDTPAPSLWEAVDYGKSGYGDLWDNWNRPMKLNVDIPEWNPKPLRSSYTPAPYNPTPTSGATSSSGSFLMGSGARSLPNLSGAISAQNAAIAQAQAMASKDRASAVGALTSAQQAAGRDLEPWQAAITSLQNRAPISDEIKNLMLGRIFDNIDRNTASTEAILAQQYSQTGRATAPVVLQRLRDKGMQEKASQQREIEIAVALENAKRQELATQLQGQFSTAKAGINADLARAIASVYSNTNYRTPDNLGALAALMPRG